MAESAQVSDVVDLSTLLFPLTQQMLIMPSVCVAEIMRLREVDGAPAWLYGSLVWRHMEIPVISFEALNGDPAPPAGTGSRIVLLNAVSDAEDLAYIGLITQGVPHLLRITPDVIKPSTLGGRGPAVLQRILIHGQRAAIPDLDYLQGQLRGFGRFKNQQPDS